jgi:para-aminobenzoate synthetase component II
MIVIVDNYDSFVFNVARYFEELGEQTKVIRNDAVTDVDLRAKAIVISPGPCTPKEAGRSSEIVSNYSGHVPILGICLGHQVIGDVFGGIVKRAPKPMHGDSSEMIHDEYLKAYPKILQRGAIIRSLLKMWKTPCSTSQQGQVTVKSWD